MNQLQLVDQIESKLTAVHNIKQDLLKYTSKVSKRLSIFYSFFKTNLLSFKYECDLQIASMRFVTESVNSATIQILKLQSDENLTQLKNEFEQEKRKNIGNFFISFNILKFNQAIKKKISLFSLPLNRKL